MQCACGCRLCAGGSGDVDRGGKARESRSVHKDPYREVQGDARLTVVKGVTIFDGEGGRIAMADVGEVARSIASVARHDLRPMPMSHGTAILTPGSSTFTAIWRLSLAERRAHSDVMKRRPDGPEVCPT